MQKEDFLLNHHTKTHSSTPSRGHQPDAKHPIRQTFVPLTEARGQGVAPLAGIFKG